MKDNKLIAEFMGSEWHKDFFKDVCIISPSNISYKFHTSWDWLMPVANEIIKSRDEQNSDCDLTNLKYALCTTNIEYLYKAVVHFITDQNN